MRISLSRKVLLLFLSLFLITALLGVALGYGMSGLRDVYREITLLQNFRFQVKHLESLRRQPTTADVVSQYEREVVLAEQYLSTLQTSRARLPEPLRFQLVSLSEQLKFYRQAFLQLTRLRSEDSRLDLYCHELQGQLLRTIEQQPGPIRNILDPLVSRWFLLLAQHGATSDAARVKGIKDLSAVARAKVGDADLLKFLDQCVLNVERRYLGVLAIREQEDYLRDSEQRFQNVANRNIAYLEKINQAARRHFDILIGAALGVALAFTLLLWIATTRYLRRFLGQTRAVMQGIQSGRFEVDVRRISNDELGDLTHFMVDVAESLGHHVGQLTLSEEKYRRLVEDISDWVWETDRQGALVYSSVAVRGILGLEPEGLLGKPMADLLGTAEAGTVAADWPGSPVLSSLRVQGRTSVATHRNGERVVLESDWGPVRDLEGHVCGYRGITRDVSERRKAEEERERLEHQLRQAQKMEAIGTLSGGIAHDFNNLLQSIGGYAELLLYRNQYGGTDHTALEKIVAATERASRLTQQMLLFSRRSAQVSCELQLNDEILRCAELLEHTIPKMIALRTELAPDLPVIMADPLQIEQIIMNLVLNARDAMPEGGVVTLITESTRLEPRELPQPRSMRPGAYVLMRVRDTGTGMAPEVCERIFEPFFTTKEVGKGTGLGLSMVYGIVQGHGGYIHCASREGEGTEFTLYLPAGPAESHAEMEPDPGEIGTGEVSGGSETILLVDDEEMILAVGAEFLQNAGYHILTATSGEEALEVLEAGGQPVDLVLLDLNMPGMGGYECLKRILADNPLQKVVITTGYADADNHAGRGLEGARGQILKPFRLQFLLREVRGVLEAH